MKVTRERILHFEKMARNVYRRAVVEKKKTGTFDKEYALNRTLNIIDRMNKLAVADSVKRESKAHCWKVYLDIQAMSHDNSIRDERQVAFKEAAAKGGTLKEIARRTDDYELIILGKLNFVEEDVYARDKTDIADSTGSDEDSQGVVSYSRSSNEDVYTYPAPKDPITFDEFSIYVLNAGWTWDNVCKWLDGEPLQWVKGGLGRNLYKALRVCKEGADNSGIIPPENFREKVN